MRSIRPTGITASRSTSRDVRLRPPVRAARDPLSEGINPESVVASGQAQVPPAPPLCGGDKGRHRPDRGLGQGARQFPRPHQSDLPRLGRGTGGAAGDRWRGGGFRHLGRADDGAAVRRYLDQALRAAGAGPAPGCLPRLAACTADLRAGAPGMRRWADAVSASRLVAVSYQPAGATLGCAAA
jgi:hypothetical protein